MKLSVLLPLSLVLWFAAPLRMEATPLYLINFSAILTQGTVSNELSDGTFNSLNIPVGTVMLGQFSVDLGAAPAPVIVVGASTLTNVTQDDAGAWITGSVSLQLPAQPGNAFPIPASPLFFTRRLVPVNGVNNVTPTSKQMLGFSYGSSCCSTVQLQFDFKDNWSTANQSVSSREFLNVLMSSLDNFLPMTPGIPQSFVLTNPNSGGGLFSLFDLTQSIPGTGPLFGVTEHYSINGNFNILSASGAQTPEPATWLTTAGALAFAWMRRRRRRGDFPQARTEIGKNG